MNLEWERTMQPWLLYRHLHPNGFNDCSDCSWIDEGTDRSVGTKYPGGENSFIASAGGLAFIPENLWGKIRDRRHVGCVQGGGHTLDLSRPIGLEGVSQLIPDRFA
jgi:hypothetical protein